jgi:MFS transporter, CP family, cyanate transporter
MARLPEPDISTAHSGPPSPYRWLVLFGLWLVYVTFGMTMASLAPLVQPITRDLGISHGSMGFVFGVWQIAYIVSAIPSGGLHDRIGITRTLFLGALIVAASALLRSLAFDYASLCLAVVLFGIGGPMVSTGSPKVVSTWFSGGERGLAMGIYVTGSACGTVLALSLTNSVLMPAFDQDWHRVLQLWSMLAFLAGLVWLAISASPTVRAKEKLAAAQPRQSQRAVITQLSSLPSVRLLMAMAAGTFIFNHSLNNWLPEILRARGFTPAQAGFWATTPIVIGILGSLTLPRLATPDRRHGVLCSVFGAAILATLLLQADSGPLLVAGMILQGIARSTMFTVMMLTLMEMRDVGERNTGTASGLLFTAAEIGGASGPILLGLVHDATGGFSAGLAILTVATSLLLVGALRLRRLVQTVPVVA